ncbi:hypothetical protein AGDE_03626 [Angomonas deanei]|uniref:Uncharacterized protein n=1 Tax=Angomonas deanei TaxID=59799 RepID=A0A7G2CE00_9TRYP|nr:hypothetical protein AGDE_03626 [Angomonas deanei]CAD2217094.1 hypothetical protein, conserved [Angomonas deanei]|eukprot:EPY40302.1 hypothetical protein AGDE_03626 [Angomonas deanei]
MSVSIKDLNDKLTKQPYVSGYTPSRDDEKAFKQIFGDNVNVIQWASRMASYYPVEREQMAAESNKRSETDSDY